MSSVRTRTLVAGSVLAVIAALLVAQGDIFGDDFPKVALLGAACGAILGLVPDRAPVARIGSFLVGFVAAWVGYALRAGYLPDIPTGRAIAALIVIGVVTVVAVATANRLPLWGGLVGVVSMVGAYEFTFSATPTGFVTESMTAATSGLLGAAIGFIIAIFAAGTASVTEAAEEHHEIVLPEPRGAADSSVVLTKKNEATA